ncbi:hypothetical protein QMK61_04460 [Fulvimonas sp. R45]|uniref:hypothetical protein n=1 Tax=Fulvimonas sp. R45 TaxID=3045937 RepID=UPI00265F481A|nr:hypothetical protein [Fulvimonas sp. R45]MDO1528079.1 hypothetical protein [Fulvimonas sp. R45]
MQEISNPEYSAFIYIPRAKDLRLVVDVGLNLVEPAGFTFDVNPYGDPDFRPVTRVEVDAGRTSLNFEVLTQDGPEAFRVQSSNPCDRELFDAIDQARESGFKFHADDEDRVEIVFHHGVLDSLDIGRHEQGDIEDYITLILRDGEWLYVRGNPSQRIPVKQVRMQDRTLTCVSAAGPLQYQLRNQPFVVRLVDRLLVAAQA